MSLPPNAPKVKAMRTAARIASVFLAALILTVGISAENAHKVYRRCTNDNMEIALTFDDGPHPRLTPEILDILNEYGVSATFFVVGENVANYPDAAMRIAKEGHEIGNHTYTHRHIQNMNKEQLACEIESCERQIIELTDEEYRTKIFRPPQGKVDSAVKELGEDMGYSVILWSIDTKDWAHTPVSKIVDNILCNVKSGDIILMHDYIGTNSPTPQVLRTIIPKLLEKGYKFVTVSELIKVEAEANKK